MKDTVEIILKQTYREKAFGNCTPGKTGKKQYAKKPEPDRNGQRSSGGIIYTVKLIYSVPVTCIFNSARLIVPSSRRSATFARS
jgi:hypothetical protein